MIDVYISLGSNIDRYQNIRQAERALETEFGELVYSPVYETEAVGFDGDNFYNSVVVFQTEKSVQYVSKALKSIEDSFGRDRTQPRFSARVIDLDLLLYGDLVLHEGAIHIPREEILFNAFVLKPLMDVAADTIHPIENKTITEIWLESDLQSIELIEVEFNRF